MDGGDDTKLAMQRALEEAKQKLARRGGRKLAKEVRHRSLKKIVHAYINDASVPESERKKRKKIAAVAYAKEGYLSRWGIKIDDRTIYGSVCTVEPVTPSCCASEALTHFVPVDLCPHRPNGA